MQQFCDGLYGYDTVWSAKRTYFTPTRATVRHYDVDEDSARGEAYGGRRRFASDCSLPPVADYEENKTQEEEEVCLDHRLVAAQSSLRSDKHRRRDTTAVIRSLSGAFRGRS